MTSSGMGRVAAQVLRACNLRTFVIAATLWLLISPNLPQFIAQPFLQLEKSFLQVALYFKAMPPSKTELTVIHVPDIEYNHWLDDLPGAGRLAQLLDQLYSQYTDNTVASDEAVTTTQTPSEKNSGSADAPELLDGENSQIPDVSEGAPLLGLILEEPIALTQPQAESVLMEIQQGRRTTDHMFAEANSVLQRREKLIEYLGSESVVLGLQGRLANQFQSIPKQPGPLAQYSPGIVNWLWPRPPLLEPNLLSPVLTYTPIPNWDQAQQHLLVRFNERFIPTFWMRFLERDASRVATETPMTLGWRRHEGVKLNEQLVPVGVDSGFMPLYGDMTGIKAPLRQISLSAALSAKDLGGWVLVGRDGSDELDHAAQVLASLSDQAYLVEPVWWPVVEKMILLGLCLFICWGVPKAHIRWVFSGLFGLAGLLVAVQVAGQVLNNYWLPSHVLLAYTALGFAVMLVWRWQQEFLVGLLRRADAASLGMSNTLMGTGDLQQALAFAKSCRTSEDVLERLYNLADRFEEAEQWSEAEATLREIRRRRWRYRDVAQRLKALKNKKRETPPISSSASLDGEVSRSDEVTDDLSSTVSLPSMGEEVQPLATFGRYRVKKELGRGACGTVFLARDPLIAREVAIKTVQYQRFSPDELAEVKARFYREAEAAGRLNHPSIVRVFDVGEQEDSAYIAMEFAQGQPLSHFIHPSHLLPIATVYRIVLEVADALAYAHSQKIVHRDIKPGNILFCDEPFQVRITDFGIARFVDHSHTRTGEILGSPLYMSPEQVLGKRVSTSSDLFSLGVMFYQLLTGCLPFTGESLASVSYDIVHGKHKGARTIRKELPASATRITNVALQKNPLERYQSAGEMADALRKAIKRDFAAEAKQWEMTSF